MDTYTVTKTTKRNEFDGTSREWFLVNYTTANGVWTWRGFPTLEAASKWAARRGKPQG